LILKQLRIWFCCSLPAVLFTLLSPTLSLADSQLTPMVKQPAAPALKLTTLDGKLINLQDYKGRPVIINFWATWCPPCRAEIPSMNRAWEKMRDQNVAMIAINIGEDKDTIRSFLADYPINFPVLMDSDSQSLQQWSISGLPTSYVLDPAGFIRYQAVGEREWDNEQLLKKVLYLIKYDNN
jgi:peroxiredoxin